MHPDVEVRLYGPGTAAERMEEFADWRPDGLIVGGNAEENLRAAARIGVRAAVLAETEPPADCPLRLGRAEEFIRENAGGGEFRIGDVAKAAFASTRLLQRNFKDVTDRTVGEALRDERLRRVRALLSETTTPIGAIAGLCGFKSDGYLKQLFRARHGCTMRDWRRRARGR